MVLMMIEFTKEVIARLEMFYSEDGEFSGEIEYMLNLLIINFDRKIILMQGLRHWKADFKNFPMVYHMSNSDYKQEMEVV